MALTPEQIDLAIQQHVDPVATYGRLHNFARAIEAEVRKHDDALIQQMHDALCECAEDSQEQLDRMEAAKLRQYKPQAVAYQEATIDAAKRAITAARARLGEKT